jgi:hypothetical protein
MARAGGVVCKKFRLKFFCDPKCAGGCGVAPISSGKDLFCQAVTQRAARCCSDLFLALSGVRLSARGALERPDDRYKTHVLRHKFAAHFIMSGGNILALQKILGHHDIKMTMRYAHLAPDHLETALRFNPFAMMKNGDKMAATVATP